MKIKVTTQEKKKWKELDERRRKLVEELDNVINEMFALIRA